MSRGDRTQSLAELRQLHLKKQNLEKGSETSLLKAAASQTGSSKPAQREAVPVGAAVRKTFFFFRKQTNKKLKRQTLKIWVINMKRFS